MIASAQRSLNLIGEPMAQAQGEPAAYAYYPTPGLVQLGVMPQNRIRALRQATTGGIYAVAGSGVYLVDPSTWAGTHLGDITSGKTTPVSMTDNGNTMLIVDGSPHGWTVDLNTHAFGNVGDLVTQSPYSPSGTITLGAGRARFTPITVQTPGAITTITIGTTAATADVQMAIYDAPPHDLLAQSDVLHSVPTGNATFTFSPPFQVSVGQTFFVAIDQSASVTYTGSTNNAAAETYIAPGSWPAKTPADPAVWLFYMPSLALNVITQPEVGGFNGGDKVDFLDTYFLVNKPGTPQFNSSDSLATTFDPLWFANKETFSDLLVTLAVAKGEIWLLGERTTEVFTDIGAADFPFQKMPGVLVDHGCGAKYSVATYDDAVYWLTYGRAGELFVVSGAGYQPKRISTYAIEYEISQYARVDDAIGFTYSLGGHAFYVLTFPTADKTWVYDITTGQWHEWLWIDTNGAEHRHRANCAYAVNGQIVVGDHANGNLYALDNTVFTDAGQPIKRVRSFPHLINDANRVFYSRFIADMESGNPAGAPASVTKTLLSCSFTAADGTLLEDYSNSADTNATWTLVSGSGGQVESDRFQGPSGSASEYQSPAVSEADYTLQFRAVPLGYAAVPVSGAVLYAIARTTGAGTGYRVTVGSDGSSYQLTLGVEGGGASSTLAMGTLTSGWFVVTMALAGSSIAVKCQRNQDGLWLQPGGLWMAGEVSALTLTDSTWTAAGTVMIGGSW